MVFLSSQRICDCRLLKLVEEKGPYTKPDKFRQGLCGSLTNSDTYNNHMGWSEINTH